MQQVQIDKLYLEKSTSKTIDLSKYKFLYLEKYT